METAVNILKNRIIAATRSDEDFLCALDSSVEVIFDLNPDLMNVSVKLKKAHEKNKRLFIHIDLAKGIGKDESGVRFLKRLGVDGVISTKVSMIKMARECSLCTVQRFFIVDSQSVTTTLDAVRSSRPDMIEIMPAIVYKVIGKLGQLTDIPIIVGGLIENTDEIAEAIASGATAVSTAKKELWS